MKKSIIYTRLALSATAFLFGAGAFAQTPAPAPKAEKKVIITVIDENGKTETRTFNGDEINNAELPAEARGALDMARQMHIDVNVEKGDEARPRVHIKRMAPYGEVNEFEWNGEGALPKEFEGQMQILEKNLEGLGNIDIQGLEGLRGLEELGELNIDIDIPELPELPEPPNFNWGCMGQAPAGCNGNAKVFIVGDEGGEPKAQLGVQMNIDVQNVNGNETHTITIIDVVPGTAAEEAGLKVGDLLTRIDGKAVTETVGVVEAVSGKKPGDKMSVTYVRDGVENTVEVTLKERKEEPLQQRRMKIFRNEIGEIPRSPGRGMSPEKACEELEKLTGRPFLGVYVNGNEDAEKLVIQSVINETGAKAAGLEAADVLLEVDGKKVNNYDDLCKAVQARKPGDKVKVKYERNGKKETVKAILGSKGDQHPAKVKALRELCEQNDKAVVAPAPEAPAAPERPTVAPVGTDITNFSTYPNPSKGVFTLSFDGAAVPTTIVVTDLQGKESFRELLNDFKGSFRGEIDLSSAAKGVYFLNITQNGRVFSEKIILN